MPLYTHPCDNEVMSTLTFPTAETPYVAVSTDWARPHAIICTTGFGLALPMLDGHPPAKHPWLTPSIVSIERAITEWSSDPERVFMEAWED